MNIELWQLFLEAAERGSLSKVALHRGITQPQVSRQLAALERQLGARLFDRTGRGVVLTEYGQRIAPRIRTWLTNTIDLQQALQHSSQEIYGRVRVGIIPSLAAPFTTSLFIHLRQQHPHIEIVVREGQGAQLERQLEDGSLDMAILFRHQRAIGVQSVPLAKSDTYLVGAPDATLVGPPQIPFKALDGIPLVGFCRPNHWRDYLDIVAHKRGVRLNVVLEADSLALQLGIVERGHAYALMGAFAIQDGLTSKRISAARIIDPSIKRVIALELPRTGRNTPATRAVMSTAQRLAAQML